VKHAFFKLLFPAILCLSVSACQTAHIFEEPLQNAENAKPVEKAFPAQHAKILETYDGEYSNIVLEQMVAKVVGRLTLRPPHKDIFGHMRCQFYPQNPHLPQVNSGFSGKISSPAPQKISLCRDLKFETSSPTPTYHITLLNSPSVNAFALSGGFVYVTRGLLALANDSSELAAVIAHEMAHVTANHGIARRKFEEESKIALSSEVLKGDLQGKQFLIKNKLKLAQFSRNQELEADEIGIKASVRAGYDPFAASRFLTSLGAYATFRTHSQHHDLAAEFLSTHPAAPYRVERAKQLADQFGAPNSLRPLHKDTFGDMLCQSHPQNPHLPHVNSGFSGEISSPVPQKISLCRDLSVGEVGRDAYLDGIDGMIFGENMRDGFMQGQDVVHKDLGVSYRLPYGFRSEKTQGVLISRGHHESAIRFDFPTVANSLTLEQYIRSGWVVGLETSSIRTTRMNGFDVVTATARAENWQFHAVILRKNGKTYRFLSAAPHDFKDLKLITDQVVASFKILTNLEKARIKPLRVRIVRIKQGEAVAQLIDKMFESDYKSELFYLLNGAKEFPAGSRVKIITDSD
jgi:predicted Zn-dependent protease